MTGATRGELPADTDPRLDAIRRAAGNPALLALTLVELTYPELGAGDRAQLRSALEAAAVPHWCDERLLGLLIDDDTDSATPVIWKRLQRLAIVEPFPARGKGAVNVHEASRLAIRDRLAATDRERLALLSDRAVRAFDGDREPTRRLERMYHLLVADPDHGADELESLHREWSTAPGHEDLAALASAVSELDGAGLLDGRAQVRAQLIVTERRADFDGYAALGATAEQLLEAARRLDDPALLGHVLCLMGDVRNAVGDPAGASDAFSEFLAISGRLAILDPGNAGWQRELAVAHSRVGDLTQALGDLVGAEAAFAESVAIYRRLVDLDPTHSGWQRELAVAHSKVGDLAEAGGDLTGAQAAFAEFLSISRRLADRDPTNTTWQRDLAIAYSRMSGLTQARGDITGTEAASTESLAISRRLADLDPTNTRWQRDLAVAHSSVGALAQAQGDLIGAQTAFAEYLAISRRLADLDPANATWQRDLDATLSQISAIARARGDLDRAAAADAERQAISRRLAELDEGRRSSPDSATDPPTADDVR